MADPQRIEELKRRIEQDPASIAFAQLADECRHAGDFEEAVRVAEEGLVRHPGYLFARVTLGRALIELERYDQAKTEFETVLASAPENLSAIRGLAEIHERRGERADGLKPAPTPPEPEIPEEHSEPISDDIDLNLATEEFQKTLDSISLDLPGPMEADPFGDWDLRLVDPVPPQSDTVHHIDPVVDELEQWLLAVLEDREVRAQAAGR